MIALSVSIVATAVPDSVITGPYKVSFDLGLTRNDYSVLVNDPREIGSSSGGKSIDYTISIKSNNYVGQIVSIYLKHYEKDIEAPKADALAAKLNNTWSFGLINLNPEVHTSMIDGVLGAIGSYENF